MNRGQIERVLSQVSETKSVTIEKGVLSLAGEIFQSTFGSRPFMVVADENTYEAAGRFVDQTLSETHLRIEPFIFPGKPVLHAEFEHVLKLEESLRAHEAIPVAVGSGTLNDIAKLASFRCGRQYMVVATAASMDGYTAFGAAITKDGYKQTMTCPAPRAVLADTQILKNAPPAMTASGYADLLGKVTAGADWLVADALGIEPLHAQAWALIQNPLRDWTGSPAALRSGDESAFEKLMEGLVMSGLAIQLAQSSRPASGSEHLFSHLWEMEGLGQDLPVPLSHGYKVGVGSIAIAALYEQVLQNDLAHLARQEILENWLSRADVENTVRRAHTFPGLREAAVKESLAKYIDPGQLTERLNTIEAVWRVLRNKLSDQLLSAGQIRLNLLEAGCPIDPQEIGLNREAFKDTYYRARQIRRRYTVLDLAAETGILTGCVETLFGPSGFWKHLTQIDKGDQ